MAAVRTVLSQMLGGEVVCHSMLPVAQRHLFSSTAAVWSQPGACNYSAANSYLDALAQQCRWGKQGSRVHSTA